MFIEGMQQRCRLQLTAAPRNPELQRMSTGSDGVFVTVNDQPRTNLFREAVPEFDHLFEFVAGIYMKKGKRQRSGKEGLSRQMNQHAGILAHGIQQYRIAKLRYSLAQNINRFAFEL